MGIYQFSLSILYGFYNDVSIFFQKISLSFFLFDKYIIGHILSIVNISVIYNLYVRLLPMRALICFLPGRHTRNTEDIVGNVSLHLNRFA
jgi:hypothetical protein